MAFIADTVLDNGLTTLDTNGTRIDICSAEPTTYAEATATLTLGNATVNTGSPIDGAIDGRRVIVPAITSGAVTTTGVSAFWALTDGASVLFATGALASPQSLTSGNTFALGAISITIRDV
jgi:hypothetical protein